MKILNPETTLEVVATPQEIERVARLAQEIWTEYYTPLIGAEQVEYMLEELQSPKAIDYSVKNKILTYYLVLLDGKDVGYLALDLQEGKLFLSKLYLLAEFRGQGFASAIFDSLSNICREEELSAIWLTCNVDNKESLDIYEHLGFEITDKLEADIGAGYVMDDYVLEKKISVEQ